MRLITTVILAAAIVLWGWAIIPMTLGVMGLVFIAKGSLRLH